MEVLNSLEDILVPIFVVVILPVSIVLIVSLSNKAKYNKKIAFFEKCVENGVEINPELLGTGHKTSSSLKKDLLNKLMSGRTKAIIKT